MPEDARDWPTGRLLSVAARLVEHSWEDLLRAQGITHAGLIALHCLGGGPMSQRALAQACRVTDQTISRTVDRLNASGYVGKARDTEDLRRKLITITSSGLAIHDRIVSAQRADSLVAAAVSDHAALRAQLIELVGALGSRKDGTDTTASAVPARHG